MQLNKPEDLCSQNSYNLFQFPFVSFQMITCNTNNTDAPYFTMYRTLQYYYGFISFPAGFSSTNGFCITLSSQTKFRISFLTKLVEWILALWVCHGQLTFLSYEHDARMLPNLGCAHATCQTGPSWLNGKEEGGEGRGGKEEEEEEGGEEKGNKTMGTRKRKVTV